MYSEKLLTLQVSRLGFGCAGLSGSLNTPLSHEEGCQIIKQAFIRGITFFDSSDLYGVDHDNEIMIGKVGVLFPMSITLNTEFEKLWNLSLIPY